MTPNLDLDMYNSLDDIVRKDLSKDFIVDPEAITASTDTAETQPNYLEGSNPLY